MQRNFVLKAKNAIKRVAAISAGASLVGATMMGAVAAQDLGDYPMPFIGEDGSLDGLVVVGADAASSDVVGAAELVSTLTQAAVTTTPGTSTVSVTGGKAEDINIGEALNAADAFGSTGLDDDDLDGFQDTAIDFDDSTYNVHDEVVLGTGFTVHSSLTASDDDYADNVAIELPKGTLSYYYVFDEVIDMTGASTTEPVEINFLGRMIEITSISATDHNSFTAQIGEEFFLSVGDSVTVDGKTVTLNDVSSSSTCTISVDVDGVSEVVSTTAETVNGIKVEADECFYADTKEDRSASVIVGEQTTKSYDDGDEFINQDEDDPDWVWDLGNLNDTNTVGGTTCTFGANNGPCLGVTNDFVRDDWDDDPIGVGEQYCLPWDYACVTFNSLTVDNYVDITMDVDTSVDLDSADAQGLTWGTSEDAIVIEANVADTITIDQSQLATSGGTKETFTQDVSTDTIYLVGNSTGAEGTIQVFYEDSENDPQYAGHVTLDSDSGDSGIFAFMDYQDTSGTGDIEISVYGNISGQLEQAVVVFQDENSNSGGSDIETNWTTSSSTVTHLGDDANQEEASEVRYGSTNLGTKDENHRTHYGIIIEDPESNGASDQVKLSLPGDVLEATVVVSGPGTTTVTSGATTVVSVSGTDVAKLDTEVSSPSSTNLILVGGPAVNRLTAQALGLSYPTFGADSTIPENKGLLRMVSNAFGGSNSALVVAGWTADDTRAAANVLKRYTDYSAQLSGKSEVEVSGTTVTAVGTSTDVE